MNKNSVSRTLSYILRHHPESIDVKLDKNGWVGVTELLSKSRENNKFDITFEELETIVIENDKQRFKFNDDKTNIRASQGHSTKVDLELKSKIPPTKLYHGTVEKALAGIKKTGLNSMSRHHLHLSDKIETATNVGARRGIPIILEIDSKAMVADGFKFYQSDNGVWLINQVPTKYIKF